MIRFLLLASFLLGLCAPSKADWQYTKWGMSPQDVVTASGSAVTETTQQERRDASRGGLTPLNKTPYETEAFKFTALFYYTDAGRKLQEVVLQLIGGSANELEFAMQDRYGTPSSKRFDSIMRVMVWEHAEEVVRFVHIVGGPPTVEYTTRRTGRARGL